MNKFFGSTAIAIGILASAAAGAQTSSSQAPSASQRPQPAGQSVKFSDIDQKFVNDAAIGGMFEVKAGRIAEKSSNAQVRQFGARMVHDHSAADDKLKKIVTAQGGTIPDALDPEHQQKLDRLASLHGQDFTREYIQAMVQDHDTDAQDFGKASQNLDNPQLKQFAAETLKVVESHDKMAHQISQILASK